MQDLTHLIRQYTIKHDRTISSLCDPLKDAYGINCFIYYVIEDDGRYGILSSHPANTDYYYAEKLYLNNPFLVHPELLRSGYALVPAAQDPLMLKRFRKRFHLYYLLMVAKRTGKTLECCLFSTPELEPHDSFKMLAHLDMLNKFSIYFKREARPLIKNMMEQGYSLQQAKGQAFYEQDPLLALSTQNATYRKLVKTLSPLSPREEECLNLFKQGKSAQATAAILGLSERTVEHYFEHIKNKMGCSSKWELLEV